MTADTGLLGQTIAGRFRIVRTLGEGGQGQVFVAVQEALGREIALKVIRGELAGDPSMVERFQREARTVAELNHAHIVDIYDFGLHEGTLFMAMELLKGDTLRERIEKGPMPVATTLSVMRDTCSALSAAHRRDVVHRDLKPDNIMLIEDGGRVDFVKILDFGIAKKVNNAAANVTQQGMIVGTPGYLAPEVAKGGTLDAKADLYALGVIWYEMLAGRSLFNAPTPMALVMKHAIEPVPALATTGISVRPEVEQLVMQLLEKDPLLRPASADAIISRIDALNAPTTATTTAPAFSGPRTGTLLGMSVPLPVTGASSTTPAPLAHIPTQVGAPAPPAVSIASPLAPPPEGASPAVAAAAVVAEPSATTTTSAPNSTAPSTRSEPMSDNPYNTASSGAPAPAAAPPPKKSGSMLAGCLKVGCGLAIVAVIGLVGIGIWGGEWLNHFYKKAQATPTVVVPPTPVVPVTPVRPGTPVRPVTPPPPPKH